MRLRFPFRHFFSQNWPSLILDQILSLLIMLVHYKLPELRGLKFDQFQSIEYYSEPEMSKTVGVPATMTSYQQPSLYFAQYISAFVAGNSFLNIF